MADPRPRKCYKCGAPKEKGKRCAPCRSEYLAKWREEKPEIVLLRADARKAREERGMCAQCGVRAKRERRQLCNVCTGGHYNSYYKKTFGITLAQYDEMMLAQGGGCAICHEQPTKKRLAVDHDHATGEVRGLLCFSCNIAIGHFRESKDLLEATLSYLNKDKGLRLVAGVANPTAERGQ